VLVEVPLLFETGRDSAFDRVIVVAAPEALQIRASGGTVGERRSGNSRGPVASADKLARADYVVDNGGSRRNTQRQVKTSGGPEKSA